MFTLPTLPSPTLLLVIALTAGWGYTGFSLYGEKASHSADKALATDKYSKLDKEYDDYKIKVADDAAKQVAAQQERDQQAREAARKTDAENQKRLRDAEVAKSGLLASIGSLRTQLTDTYAAKLAAEAASGDVARLAARAAAAGKLLNTCSTEYGQLAQDAERVRLQALGLYGYIRDNRACSTPFGSAAP